MSASAAGFRSMVESMLEPMVDAKVESILKAIFGDVSPKVAAMKVTTGAKRGRKPGSTNKPKPEGGEGESESKGKLSLKDLVVQILKENPSGLLSSEITQKVQEAIDAGTYSSNSANIAANIAQALHSLKKEKGIVKAEDSKKYTVAA